MADAGDLIERPTAVGLLEPDAKFGATKFRRWAQAICGAVDADQVGYESFRSSGNDPARKAWQDQPWVTPVVGSGPIGFPQDFAEKAAWLPSQVVAQMEAAVKRRGPASDLEALEAPGADPAIFVPSFVNGLIERRYGVAVGPARGTPPELAIDDSVVWVVVAAAQLTRTFHRMSLDSSRPISRWGSEKAEVRRDDPRWTELGDEYLPLLHLACERAETTLRERAEIDARDPRPDRRQLAAAANAIADLIKAIDAKLNDQTRQVLLVHLEQLTDASWYLLAQTVLNDIDPGWTSLLLQLVLTQSDAGAIGVFRPRWNELESVGNAIRDVYLRASASSSSRRRGPERRSDITEFYQSVAELLWAQAGAVRWAVTAESLWSLPRPVTWVCSFDYEVELALWRAAAERKISAEFAVVMPVYVRQPGRESHGTLVWLEATIEVPRGAADLDDAEAFRRATTVASWRLVTNNTDEGIEGDLTRHRPVVVHLLGCPVLDLPDIADPTTASGASGQNLLRVALVNCGALGPERTGSGPSSSYSPAKSALVHAVTVDEFLAVRQTARDWGQGSDTKEERSLPLEYFRAAGPARRFYAVLGVPMRDPAIRLRLTAVLTRGTMLSDAGAGHGVGLFINKKVDDEELTFLGVLGLHVFKARCEDFATSMSGYGVWLGKHCHDIDRWARGTGAEKSGVEQPSAERPGVEQQTADVVPAAVRAKPKRTPW